MANNRDVYKRSLALLALIAAMPTDAANVEITAKFSPDSASPQKNTFINTTPVSGYCLSFAAVCQRLNMFSIRLPLVTRSITSMQPGMGSRDNAMFQVPANWRQLYVTNAATGGSERVEVRITGIGSRYVLSRPVTELTGEPSADVGHRRLWGLGWVNAPAPCATSGLASYGASTYTFFWLTPVEASCVKIARFLIPSMYYQYLDFAYELRTPNPLAMGVGNYTGHLRYSLGPHGDFDFGDVMRPDETELILNFNLTVEHTLKVEIPPGARLIQLEPEGGWQAWLHQGRKPGRLFRDQTVNLWASSQFKMTLECAEPLGNTCSVRNEAGHQVPLDVAVSLPPGLSDASGRPVNRLPLRLDGSGTELFQPSIYVDRKPSTLHFEIKADAVKQMLEQPGSTYTGTATVVWDSEV